MQDKPRMGDRVLTEPEQEAWREYDRVLDKYKKYNVRAFDRVSIHNAFPEIKKAFERAVNSKIFYRLTKDYEGNTKAN